MAKPELGTKRLCAGCSAKFYDLGKDPAVCPTCETIYVEPKIAQSRGGRSATPRTVYDPHNQADHSMGTLKETEAPAVAEDGEAKEEADDVLDTEDADEAEETGGVPMLEELDEK